jgi:hypothetical protein
MGLEYWKNIIYNIKNPIFWKYTNELHNYYLKSKLSVLSINATYKNIAY